ncbi:hypothetical protein FQN49_006331 [Arthroderma sp. PD_2]|nr:hypothetical protein FQN49_006331 [Arthroderma sp. PD_2]
MDNTTPRYIANQQYTSGWWTNQLDGVHSAIEIVGLEPLTVPASHDFPPGQFACPEFIDCLPSTQVPLPPTHCSDWTYEQRRTAQEVLPFLYLGPATITRDKDFLLNEGITLLLAIRDRNRVQALTVNGDKTAADLGIESDFLEVSDAQELISQFPNVIRRINNHICPCPVHRALDGRQRKVLVFCDTGNEKSACIVAVYLMAMYHARAIAAASHVQVRRLCTNLGVTFGSILTSFESILDAQKAVVRNQQNQGGGLQPGHKPSRKRSFDDSHESSMECGGTTEAELAQEEKYPTRPSQPPFRDSTSG